MRPPIRGWAGAAAAALVLVPWLAACRAEPVPPAAPAPSPALVAVLAPAVGPDALRPVAVAVRELSQRCPDLPSAEAAAAATVRAGERSGLARHDERWASAADRLLAGVAAVSPGDSCGPQLAGWLAGVASPPTIPEPAPATTTTAPGGPPAFGPPVEPVSYATFRRVRPGMYLGKVRRLFRLPGTLISESTIGRHHDELIWWPAAGGGFFVVIVQFRDGRVVAASSPGEH